MPLLCYGDLCSKSAQIRRIEHCLEIFWITLWLGWSMSLTHNRKKAQIQFLCGVLFASIVDKVNGDQL